MSVSGQIPLSVPMRVLYPLCIREMRYRYTKKHGFLEALGLMPVEKYAGSAGGRAAP